MPGPGSAGLFASLRSAARLTQERFLVGLADAGERARVVAALSAEGAVVELPSAEQALDRLAEESFELAVLEEKTVEGQRDPFATARELRPFADVVLLLAGDPERCSDFYAREVAALLTRPLPESDALFRAHLRWLASCRRGRTRELLLGNAIADHRAELEANEPALASALDAALGERKRQPSVMVMGDAELAKLLGGATVSGSADVVVVGVAAEDRIDTRLREARSRAAGAAVVVVDATPTSERLGAAVYGGVRAYLGRAQVGEIGRVVASTASRRRAEVMGRQLVETLARFGVMDQAASRGSTSAAPQDVDAKLIADTAASEGEAVVPSAHEVLVVDDEVVVLTVLREILRRGGYRVTTAASAEEAIDLMHKRHFDLVLTDKNLPGASGLEVLRVARTLDPQPAVVMITGYSSYDSAVEALDIGAQDYIEKPIRDVEALRFRIRRALSRRDEQLARAQASLRVDQDRRGEKGRVLVVEEEGPRRQLIAEFLGRAFNVTAAANGDEALGLIKEQHYDVVLADRNLPGMSGLRVIEQAQRLLPHCASVLYTAYPSYETVKEAFEAGVDGYLARPSEDLKALAEKVAGALRSRGGILLG
ncbi:MAG: response regulator [Polyangia bacterium]